MKLYDSYYKEIIRQRNSIELIASENFVSKDVLKALGTILTNKYAEGYPGKRYYGGCEFVDEIETETIELTKKLFNCKFANVQPHSGSQANQGVYAALLNPGDRILGMSLDCGGHLTHGSKVSSSGILYESYSYGVNSDGYIDYEEVEKIALETKPKLIVCGASAYARLLDFTKFRKIADKVGAYLLADIAHIAGLVVTGLHPSPIGIADVVTSTTHKTLRGPRGGIIMTNDEEISKKINKAIFPGIQGGPLMNVIFAKGVAFEEALNPNYKNYMEQVVKNIKALASTLIARGFKLVSSGTDNHLLLMDFSDFNFSGKDAQLKLEEIGITANKNSVPNEKRSPFITSGLRIGSPAMTTRGFKEAEFNTLGEIIADCLLDLDTKANLKCRVNLLMQPFERTLNV